ncbi:hypothetical protein RMATCC62417_04386 [Rhizopus microsporus]|nr:hypothetical protein RMATCC62417_04386 [Rhizopus microsporus]
MKGLKINTPSKRKAKQQIPTELNWVYKNIDSFNHIKFFDFFQSYDRPTSSRRFKYIVANFISEENKRNEILENYNTWKRKKEAKLYWKQREKQRNDKFMNNFVAMDKPVLLTESTSTSKFNESNSTTTTIISVDSMKSSNTSTPITVKSDDIGIDQAKTLISEAVCPPDEDDCYMIGNMNVSTCFFDFQTFVQSLLNERLLNFESYLQHILSLSSILLVGKNRVHSDLLKLLKNGTEDDIINDVHKKIKMNENKFPRLILMEILDIVQDAYQKKITRIKAARLLLDLTDDQSDLVIRIILCFKRLVEDLPDELLTSTIREFGLCTSFLQPAIKPLFDNAEKKVVFTWTNAINSEFKKEKNQISKSRPDGCITIINNNNEEKSVCFAEVKTLADRTNHYKLNLDLYRLGIFSKDAIDVNNLNSVLAIQAVGSYLTFYLTQLKNDGLYLMVELDHLRFPMSLNELPQLIGYVDRLYDILNVFEEFCMLPAVKERPSSKKRETMKLSILSPLIEKTIDRSRANCFQYHYN